MHVGSLSSIYNHFIQPILSSTLGARASTVASAAGKSPAVQGDSQQLSPFAQIATTLQQLQQQSSTLYQSVTGRIAINLQKAAGAAQSAGDTTLANQLTQLSADFTNASQNNQLPDFHSLAQSIAGGRHPTPAASLLSQFTAAGQNQALNPASIVFSALSGAGISLG